MLPGLAGFIGAAVGGGVQLIPYTDDETAVLGDSASTFYQLRSDGYINVSSGGGLGTAILGQWLLSGSGSDYEVRMTETSGAFSGGVVGVWTSPVDMWRVDRTTVGSSRAVGLMEIRRISDHVVLGSAVVDLKSTIVLSA